MGADFVCLIANMYLLLKRQIERRNIYIVYTAHTYGFQYKRKLFGGLTMALHMKNEIIWFIGYNLYLYNALKEIQGHRGIIVKYSWFMYTCIVCIILGRIDVS